MNRGLNLPPRLMWPIDKAVLFEDNFEDWSGFESYAHSLVSERSYLQ